MTDSRHENYEILNLIGYGLAKFNLDFVWAFGFATKAAFYRNIISRGIADSIGTVKNRQDLFDPFLKTNERAGGKKETFISIEKLLLIHYLQTIMPVSLQVL
jgi:hypothetical protein